MLHLSLYLSISLCLCLSIGRVSVFTVFRITLCMYISLGLTVGLCLCGSVVFPILIVLKIIVEVCEKRLLDTQILGGADGGGFQILGWLRHPSPPLDLVTGSDSNSSHGPGYHSEPSGKFFSNNTPNVITSTNCTQDTSGEEIRGESVIL